jgi:hypothetical protein
MIYANMVQVLDESCPRMTQENLYQFSHSLSGFSFYTLKLDEKSSHKDMEFIEQTLTRQGIPCVIYPDRLLDDVIVVKFSKTGELIRRVIPYKFLFEYKEELRKYSHITREAYQESIQLVDNWENQERLGNIFSIKQFIKPDEE